jgi:hypothetical protein
LYKLQFLNLSPGIALPETKTEDYAGKVSFILSQSGSCPLDLPVLALRNGQKRGAWVQK